MEKRKVSQEEIRRGEVLQFIDTVYAESKTGPKLPHLKPSIALSEPYKALVVDTATNVSLLSNEQVREEAARMDEEGYAWDTVHQWKSLLEESAQHKHDLDYYYRGDKMEPEEKKKIENTLLRQAVTNRTMRKALVHMSSVDQQKHQQQSELAVNLSIRAVVTLSK